VGLALTDGEKTIAFPRAVIRRENDITLAKTIKKMCTEEGVERIIVGLPLDEDDGETDRSRRIRSFTEKLSSIIETPISFQDEAYSSTEAESLMGKKKPATRRDDIAAQKILERYLGNL